MEQKLNLLSNLLSFDFICHSEFLQFRFSCVTFSHKWYSEKMIILFLNRFKPNFCLIKSCTFRQQCSSQHFIFLALNCHKSFLVRMENTNILEEK